jgi:hypothetical protein
MANIPFGSIWRWLDQRSHEKGPESWLPALWITKWLLGVRFELNDLRVMRSDSAFAESRTVHTRFRVSAPARTQ